MNKSLIRLFGDKITIINCCYFTFPPGQRLNQNYLEPSLVHCRDNVAQHLKALLAPFQMCPTRHSYWSSLGVAVTFSKVGFMSHHIFRSTCTCTLKWVLWHTLLLHMLHNVTNVPPRRWASHCPAGHPTQSRSWNMKHFKTLIKSQTILIWLFWHVSYDR